jgi:hypothetical protein
VAFVLLATMILPQFSLAWRFCQARAWYVANGSYTNCSARYSVNSTPVTTNDTHTENGETIPFGDGDFDNPTGVREYCQNCDTAGGYRQTNQGLLLLVLVIGLVGIAVAYLKMRGG